MVKYCYKCNSANVDRAKFCSQCGSRLSNMTYEEEERVYEDDYLFYMLNEDDF